MRRPAGTHNDVSSNALHHHCVHQMDVRISIDPHTHLKEEWGYDVTLIEDDTHLVGVPVHKTSSWSSQISILSSIPSWIRYQRLTTNLLNSALSPTVLPARGPTTVANLFCSYIALNAVNNVKANLEVGKGWIMQCTPWRHRSHNVTSIKLPLETRPNLSSAPCTYFTRKYENNLCLWQPISPRETSGPPQSKFLRGGSGSPDVFSCVLVLLQRFRLSFGGWINLIRRRFCIFHRKMLKKQCRYECTGYRDGYMMQIEANFTNPKSL